MPLKPGVYIFKDAKNQILYVGKANSLRVRVSSYFQKGKHIGPRTAILVTKIAKIDHIVVDSELEALLLEANLIKKHEPPFNVQWTDGKAYPFIKITVKAPFPAVLQSRKMDDPKALFFGPFPNIGDVRRILKYVRRIFPYHSVANHPKRVCLYNHLGLCPCLPVFNSEEERKKYKRNIKYIREFLSGEKNQLLKNLEKEMKQYIKQEEYEQAGLIKKQIETITIITSPKHTPAAYIENPNLLIDEAALSLEELQDRLKEHKLHIDTLNRIECYDISNTSGKQATGSMVVATNGIIDKSQYRKFKIISLDSPNDVFMHQEMLRRRLNHLDDWGVPDLIVIDGGAAQVGAATQIILQAGLKIPVIGLAKRLEEIVILASQGESLRANSYKRYRTLRLPRESRALRLLQRLRDEAHRFAITYHRKLRRKNFLPS